MPTTKLSQNLKAHCANDLKECGKNGVVATFLHGMDGRQSTRDSLYTEKMGFSFWKSHIGKWVKGKGNEMKDSPVLFYYKPIYLYKSFKS